MKKYIFIFSMFLSVCFSAYAVPVSIQNLSNIGNSAMPGGYDANIHLGVRQPDMDCSNDVVFFFLLTPGSMVFFDGQTPMGGTCLQDFFFGVPCSNTTYNPIFPGMRFFIQQGTFPGAFPIPPSHSIGGFTTQLHCNPDHYWLSYIPPMPPIQNPSMIPPLPLGAPNATHLAFIDLGFMHQYTFY